MARVNIASSKSQVSHSRENALSILRSNGCCIATKSKVLKKQVISRRGRSFGPNLYIRHICEKFARQIRQCVTAIGLPINVVVIPPPNLRKIFMRIYDPPSCRSKNCIIYPENGLGCCQKQGVVYTILCECGELYIGETGRPLGERVSEHLWAFKNPKAISYQNNPFARHRNHIDSASCPSVGVSILAHSGKVVERKVAEAYHIFQLKPQINGKEGMEGLELLIK